MSLYCYCRGVSPAIWCCICCWKLLAFIYAISIDGSIFGLNPAAPAPPAVVLFPAPKPGLGFDIWF